MGDARTRIEQQMTMLFRRAQKVHVMANHAEVDLDRSAYAILCRVDDEGPQRLGAVATAFGLDPSTITRQVQSLERAGLAGCDPDPRDRRVTILSLTEPGLRFMPRVSTGARGTGSCSRTGRRTTSKRSPACSSSSTAPSRGSRAPTTPEPTYAAERPALRTDL